jgi:hypothetical protein
MVGMVKSVLYWLWYFATPFVGKDNVCRCNMKKPDFTAVNNYRNALRAVMAYCDFEVQQGTVDMRSIQVAVGTALAQNISESEQNELQQLLEMCVESHGDNNTPSVGRKINLAAAKYSLIVQCDDGSVITGSCVYDIPDENVGMVAAAADIAHSMSSVQELKRRTCKLDALLN